MFTLESAGIKYPLIKCFNTDLEVIDLEVIVDILGFNVTNTLAAVFESVKSSHSIPTVADNEVLIPILS